MVAARSMIDEEEDQHVILGGMTWRDFEAMLEIRGDRAGVRMFFLDGAIEFMSPSENHEDRKTTLARLLELWATLEADIVLNGYGSWTLKRRRKKASAEPDECYVVGERKKKVPDLVIEVEWSRELGLEKEEIYRRLGVGELWTLQRTGELVVRTLENDAWVERKKSKLFPTLDLPWLLSFLDIQPQGRAVNALRDALRRPKQRKR